MPDPANPSDSNSPDNPQDPPADQPSPQDSDLDPTRPASGAPSEGILETESPLGEAKHDPYAALRHKNFRRFAFGWLLSIVAVQIEQVAVGWELYQRTGEALSLGYLALTVAAPSMLLAIPAGYLADTLPRRRLILLSMVGVAVTAFGLAAVSWFQLPVVWMYLLVLLQACAMTLGRPSRQAILPSLVPRQVFPNAVMWNSSMFQVSSVAGPALGGLILAYSIPLAYLVAAFGSLSMGVAILSITITEAKREHTARGVKLVVEGLSFLKSKKVLLAAISLDMVAVLLGGADYLLPIFARDILDVGEVGFGWLRAAPASGAIVMAMVLAHTPPMKHAGAAMLWAVVGFGAATIVFGMSTNFWLSMAMLFAIGACDNISVVVRHTLVQVLTPDAMRGRVSAVNGIFISASNELGGLESGVVAHYFGPIFSVVSGGIGTICSVGLIAALSPGLRKFGRLEDAHAEHEADEKAKAAAGSSQ